MDATSALLKMQQNLRKMKRHGRHVPKIVRYGTPKKIANIMLAEWELRQQKTILRCLPYYFIIDVCNVCNLRCPLCPTGNTTIARKQAMLSLEQYKELFDKVRKYALVVSLYNHGEPLLNPDVFSIIEYTHRNRVGTNISSNFNWPQPVDINDFIRSGLDYVTVSLDGVTQEAYQQYRVRGDIAEVFDNMKRLLAAKRALKSKTPFVEWQFIVFKHNEHEMDEARRLAPELGVRPFAFRVARGTAGGYAQSRTTRKMDAKKPFVLGEKSKACRGAWIPIRPSLLLSLSVDVHLSGRWRHPVLLRARRQTGFWQSLQQLRVGDLE